MKAILSLILLGSLNVSAMEMDIFCETGYMGKIDKFTVTRTEQVIEKISDTLVVKARINDYNVVALTVESSDKYYFTKNIPQAETIVAKNSAVFIAPNYLRSVDDDQQNLGATVCGSSVKKVSELRKYLEEQAKKLGSE